MRELEPRSLLVWTGVAAIAVLLLFPLLHSYMSHAASIVVAGALGVAVGALGYRTGGPRSAKNVTLAGALGGGAGLLALHVLPLLH